MRRVTAASAVRIVQPSMNGSSGAPTLAIWMRWSITENQVKPASSAHRALACTASKMAPGSVAGSVPELPASVPNSQEGLWMPNFMGLFVQAQVPLPQSAFIGTTRGRG
jgi:hypothetical protein